ncbi:MAG: GNAT family N-acetyltransferase [Clostridia bacterium]|nr:GNAT family N-acetyltransferase [Clostridia bacterium]
MIIRRASEKDLDGVNKLLFQVLNIHHNGRPDLFKENVKKYSDKELLRIFSDYNSPVFVAVDENGNILGYAFCVFQKHIKNGILKDIKTLYVDDLCVDEKLHGQHIGTALYEHVLNFAKANGCYNVTLNVWAFNGKAIKFYEKRGLAPQKITMEKIL